MTKLFIQKTQIFLFILALIVASIACNAPRNAEELEKDVEVNMGWSPENPEECYSTDRDEYEIKAGILGQAPEIPKYPESAVYEVCYIDSEVSSVRMADGEAPEDNEVTENVGNDSIPAGTYTGEFYYNEDHADNDVLMANEINVNISNKGIVDGSANLQFNWSEITNNPELCTHYFEKGTSYIISGQINGVDRETVEVQKSTYQIIEHSPCGEYERSDQECSCEGVLTVSDGELKIRCGSDSDCGVVLFAKR